MDVPQRVIEMGAQRGDALGQRTAMVPVFTAGTVEEEGVRKGEVFQAVAADSISSSLLVPALNGGSIMCNQLGGWVQELQGNGEKVLLLNVGDRQLCGEIL